MASPGDQMSRVAQYIRLIQTRTGKLATYIRACHAAFYNRQRWALSGVDAGASEFVPGVAPRGLTSGRFSHADHNIACHSSEHGARHIARTFREMRAAY